MRFPIWGILQYSKNSWCIFKISNEQYLDKRMECNRTISFQNTPLLKCIGKCKFLKTILNKLLIDLPFLYSKKYEIFLKNLYSYFGGFLFGILEYNKNSWCILKSQVREILMKEFNAVQPIYFLRQHIAIKSIVKYKFLKTMLNTVLIVLSLTYSKKDEKF